MSIPKTNGITAAADAITAIFDGALWEVRGKKLDLKDKKLEIHRARIEAEDEAKIVEILHNMEKAKLWNDAEMEFLKGLEDLRVFLPKRRLRRILKKGRKRFNKLNV